MQVPLLGGKVDCGSTLMQFYVRCSCVMRDQWTGALSCESSLFLDSKKLVIIVAGNLSQTVVNILYVVFMTLGLSRTVFGKW